MEDELIKTLTSKSTYSPPGFVTFDKPEDDAALNELEEFEVFWIMFFLSVVPVGHARCPYVKARCPYFWARARTGPTLDYWHNYA